jgi:hypothetical protein
VSTFIGVALSLATGVLASMLFWWWQAKLLQPKVTICPTLAKYELPDGRRVCELKVVNNGRRPAADILLTVRLIVPGLASPGANQVFKLREESFPWLDRGEDHYFLISLNQLSETSKTDYGQLFPNKIADAFVLGTEADIPVWEVLELCIGATINVYLAANDAFSGARAFQKQTFQLSDLREGAFLEDSTCSHTGRYQEVQLKQDESSLGEA